MLPHVWQNGVIKKAEDVKIGLSDLGLLRGYSIFDFFPIHQAKPVFYEDYVDRFFASAGKMKLHLAFDRKQIYQHVLDLIAKNEIKTGYARFLLTGGSSPNGFTPTGNSNFLIILYPDIDYGEEFFAKGVKLITHDYVRHIPLVKTTSYVEAILNQSSIREANAFDLLFVKNDMISESSRSNFFIVKPGNVVVTAKDDILRGITRMRMIEFAQSLYKVEERDLHINELQEASEAFMTSSTKGAVGVVQIDDLVIGNGQPGPITKHLQALYLDARQHQK